MIFFKSKRFVCNIKLLSSLTVWCPCLFIFITMCLLDVINFVLNRHCNVQTLYDCFVVQVVVRLISVNASFTVFISCWCLFQSKWTNKFHSDSVTVARPMLSKSILASFWNGVVLIWPFIMLSATPPPNKIAKHNIASAMLVGVNILNRRL